MKKPGEQSQSDTQDGTDPQNRVSKRAVMRRIGATVTAGTLTLALGAGARVGTEPNTIHGTAEASAGALRDPMIYFKSDERNKRLAEAVDKYSGLILRDMNNHPERTQFGEDSPSEDNDDNVKGHGSLVETVKVNNDTYKFILPGSQYGSVVDSGELIMSRSTVENGQPVQREVHFVQRSSDKPWNTEIDDSTRGLYDGTLAEVNFNTAERPNQTGQMLQENDNRALMVAGQYLEAAGITE